MIDLVPSVYLPLTMLSIRSPGKSVSELASMESVSDRLSRPRPVGEHRGVSQHGEVEQGTCILFTALRILRIVAR